MPRGLIALTGFASLAVIAACGGAPASPSGPGSATIAGTIVAPGSTAPAGMSSVVVSIQGTAMTTTVNSASRFEFKNVPTGDLNLTFAVGGGNANLPVTSVQSDESIALAISLSGAEATLESSRRAHGSETQLEGRVESLPPTTAAATLVVAGQTVRTTADTRFFLNGAVATFADLVIGVRVHVKGTSEGLNLLASVIDIQNTNADIQVPINGIIQAFAGTPAAFQFTIDGRLIKGDALTEFFGNSVFGDLANSRRAEVKGRQRDGYVYAVRIHVNIDDTTPPPGQDTSASIEGPLTAKSGAGSVLTLIVGGTTVKTSASTEVRRRGDVQDLSVLQLGMTLHVVGDRQPDSSINARMIQIKDDAVGAPFEIEGSMGGVHGTCPSLTFGVNGFSVFTDAATVFTPVCSEFKSGTKAKVKGIMQADGTVKAISVQKQ